MSDLAREMVTAADDAYVEALRQGEQPEDRTRAAVIAALEKALEHAPYAHLHVLVDQLKADQ